MDNYFSEGNRCTAPQSLPVDLTLLDEYSSQNGTDVFTKYCQLNMVTTPAMLYRFATLNSSITFLKLILSLVHPVFPFNANAKECDKLQS